MPMGLCGTGGATASDKSKGYWYREYCSDPTWGSSKCSNVCLQNGIQTEFHAAQGVADEVQDSIRGRFLHGARMGRCVVD